MYCEKCGKPMEKSYKHLYYDQRTGKPIYRLEHWCKDCGIVYIGSTGDELVKRWWLGEELSPLQKITAFLKYHYRNNVSDMPDYM